MEYQRLKGLLDNLYNSYDFKGRSFYDPIEFPRRYSDRADIEVAGFIASSLAYGRVSLFKPVIEMILGVMGSAPAQFLLSFDIERDSGLFSGIRYRFNKTGDIVCLLYSLSCMLVKAGSIENAFLHHFDGKRVSSAIGGVVEDMRSVNKIAVYGVDEHRPGFLQFIPSPRDGSPCKRMNLFLRWMVRDGDIDLGVWKSIPKDRLIIPLDTHIARISRCLGLTRRKSQDWRMAEEITESLRMLDPDDPLKYDFALCHQGIMGMCKNCIGSRSSCPALKISCHSLRPTY